MNERSPAGSAVLDALCAVEWVCAIGLLALLCLALAGCATPTPEVRIVREPVEVRVPVPVACVTPEQLPRLAGLEADAALAQRGDYDLVLSIEQQRRLLRAHVQQTDALLAACARAVPLPPPTQPTHQPKELSR